LNKTRPLIVILVQYFLHSQKRPIAKAFGEEYKEFYQTTLGSSFCQP